MEEDNDVGELDPEIRSGCFPYGFWNEFRALWKLAWPLSLSMMFHYLIQPMSIAFCGHLGKTELAAVAMAISVIYVVGVSIGRGLGFGGDTFFSQTYGSHNKKNVGVYLQKGIIFCVFWTMPVLGVLLNTENFLLVMRQDPDVARLAQEYVQLFSPGVFAYCCLFMVMRYLICQNRVIPILVICFTSCCVNALLNYGLIYQADMGIKGSAIALFLTYYLVLFLMLGYIWGTKMYRETWDGWSVKCLEDWGEFSQVISFSIFMTVLYWVCTEVGTFLGGILSPRDLSAFSISFQIEGLAWMIPLGIGGGCTARLGQYLGANKPKGAATTARVAFVTVVFVSAVFAALCFVTRHLIPRIFTTNKDLIDYTSDILRLTALFLLFEGFGGIGAGIVRGTGRQALGTVIMLVSYYLVSWPVGIPLMFATHLGLSGLWWGLDLGLFVQDICIVIFLLKLDWNKEAEKAIVRARVGTSQEEPTEHTALLNNNATSINDVENGSGATPVTVLLLKRLPVFLLFATPLVAGILTRIFLPKYSAFPMHNITSTTFSWHDVDYL